MAMVALPKTYKVTLCGNSSTDDKGIVLWSWTSDEENEYSTDMIHVHEKCLTGMVLQ